jgi:hypothetical protein
VLEAPSTNDGDPTIINYTECRDHDVYYDFGFSEGCDSFSTYCCYIGINSSWSECCWFDSCSEPPDTNISGTNFSCAASSSTDSSYFGSSSGWLMTSWPIEGGETFTLTFHIHDTADSVYDSAVIIDAFEFLDSFAKGTIKVPE